jgi:hypothetical protein
MIEVTVISILERERVMMICPRVFGGMAQTFYVPV